MKKATLLILAGILLTGALFARGAQAPAASRSQEMYIMNGINPQTLDPSLMTGDPESRIYYALFEPLVSYDPRTAEPIPGCAESWSFSNNNSTITFRLRAGLVWSDGTPITAQTVVDSWLHTLNPATAAEFAYMIADVVKGATEYMEGTGRAQDVAIRAVDARTFEVNLIGPIPYAISLMGMYTFSPLPMHVIQRYGTNWTRPENIVSNGAFILSEYIPNSRIVCVPNERYWNRANVYLTKITFDPTDDQNTMYQAFLAGEADWSTTIPLARIDEVKLNRNYQTAPQNGTYYFLINTQDHPPLRDARVRKALAMGFDKVDLLNNVVRGGQIPASGITPPMPGYEPVAGNPFDVTEARRLLAEAGYPNGQGLPTFEIVYNTSDAHRIICEYIQQAWRNNLGVNVTLRNMEWTAYLDYRDNPAMQIARAGWLAAYLDPNAYLELLVTGNGSNDGKYSNPEFDRLVRQASTMSAGPERNRVLRQAEELAINQEQAVIPIYWYVTQNMINLDVWEGWYSNPLDVHPFTGVRRK